jgi:hypothetical protein
VISWKVPDILAKVKAKQQVKSSMCVFTLPGGEIYQLGLGVKFDSPGFVGAFIHLYSVDAPNCAMLSRFPVNIGGSTIICKHRNGRDERMTMPADILIDAASHGRGRNNFISLDRLIEFATADGSIQMSATVRAVLPNETVLY